MARLRWTPKAAEDLEIIKRYIEEDDPQAAVDMLLAILERAEQLCEFPLSGPALPVKRHAKDVTRYLAVESYLLFYKPEGDMVSIIRVLHVRQDIRKLLDD